MDDAVKIYGLCLERLKHQIGNARKRADDKVLSQDDRILLESYQTGDIDEIVDILELYDIGERTTDALREKLDDLAFTVSALTFETLSFGFTGEGHLGLYLAVRDGSVCSRHELPGDRFLEEPAHI